VLASIFAGKVSPLVERFVALLARKGRAASLASIVDAFQAMLDEMRNIAPATITTAIELDADHRRKLEAQLGAMSGRTLRPEYKIDPSLIGGFRALFGDRMIDASVRHQLDRLRDALIEGQA
jgi:F-type H+-transporting ATPase subunit delta